MISHKRRALVASVGGFAASLVLPASSRAQGGSYPDRPVKLVVPFPPGGVADLLGRILAQRLTDGFGEQFVVENRDGASSNIGSSYVSQAKPDGYTILLGASNITVNMSLYKSMPLDASRDLAPISLLANASVILVSDQNLPVKSVSDLIALAKEKPSHITVASSGGGSPAHLAAVQFMGLTQTKMIDVAYRGAGPAVVDLLGGRVNILFGNIPSVLQFIKAGKIRPLALAEQKRTPALPDVPTMAEAGVPGFEQTGWYGLMAPVGTPPEIIKRLNVETEKILAMPEVREQLLANGAYPQGGSPERFAEVIKADIKRYAEYVKEGKLKVE